MYKQSSLKRRRSNPNLARSKELLFDPITDKGQLRYVPDPTFHSRRALKVSRTKSNPERRATRTADGYRKEKESLVPGRYCDVDQVQGVIQEQPTLSYFAYLGRGGEYCRQRSIDTGNLTFIEKPVIVTATSVVLPDATSETSHSDAKDEFDLPSGSEYADNYRTSDHIMKSGFESIIDCCSCMCCAKAVLYHCTKDSDDEGTMADHACTCRGPRPDCLKRWGVLGILTMFMPCLLCYLPLDGCNRCYVNIKQHFP